MRPRVTEDALIQAFEDEGITVIETMHHMEGGRVAWYSKVDRVVAIRPDLMQRQRVPALLHEFLHHLRGDDGPQCRSVEDAIDRQVAQILVDPAEYAFWEGEFGWSTGGIAAALELPRWVIEAYRKTLSAPRFVM